MESTTTPLQQWIAKYPTTVWSTNNYQNLSTESIIENTLNYGTWQQFQELQQLLGINQLYQYFNHLIHRKRVNLKPQTINYFTLYFHQHASRNS